MTSNVSLPHQSDELRDSKSEAVLIGTCIYCNLYVYSNDDWKGADIDVVWHTRCVPTAKQDRKEEQLPVTPHHLLMPKLEWVGKVLGHNLYMDLSHTTQPEKRRDLAEKILFKALSQPITKEDKP